MRPFQQPRKNAVIHTVYLIDDDSSSRRGLTNLLTIAGYKVESFKSVGGFFQIQTIDSQSCLIIDVWVQGLSIEDLRTDILKKDAHIPMIFLSARDDKISMDKAIQANAAGFFHKPVDGSALIDAISWEIEKQRLAVDAKTR
jgi:FixJ family two-component response regulator